MLQASGTRKISQPRSKDGKARQAGPMQSDLQRNAVDLYAVDGGGRWRSVAKCPQAPGFQTWPPCLESCSFGALHRRRWAPTNPGSIAAAIEIRRASGVAGTMIADLPVRSRLPGRLGHRRQGIRPVRRGHAKSGREDLDLPPARSHTPLCIRTATRLVARRRCGKIRQISARFHKPTVAGVDHRGQTLRKVPRGQRGVPEDPCGKEPRNHVCANLPTPCRLAWPPRMLLKPGRARSGRNHVV